mmetsp:Transcript_7931/g.22233  ORF Transcript_7931/g.22233 Transcript_7931/m.22233 type:complete len:238 (-) Transcript_7931:914-1627(-)
MEPGAVGGAAASLGGARGPRERREGARRGRRAGTAPLQGPGGGRPADGGGLGDAARLDARLHEPPSAILHPGGGALLLGPGHGAHEQPGELPLGPRSVGQGEVAVRRLRQGLDAGSEEERHGTDATRLEPGVALCEEPLLLPGVRGPHRPEHGADRRRDPGALQSVRRGDGVGFAAGGPVVHELPAHLPVHGGDCAAAVRARASLLRRGEVVELLRPDHLAPGALRGCPGGRPGVLG